MFAKDNEQIIVDSLYPKAFFLGKNLGKYLTDDEITDRYKIYKNKIEENLNGSEAPAWECGYGSSSFLSIREAGASSSGFPS